MVARSYSCDYPIPVFELDLPLIGTFPPQAAPDAGVTPDILVARTASDIAKEQDPELAIAVRLKP